MKFAISGTHGFIGRALVRHLVQQGHTVQALSRQGATPAWAKADGADVLIHLAGRSISSRWSPRQKARMLNERTEALRTLGQAVVHYQNPPHTFIIASAIGYYGATHTPAPETAPMGQGFAAQLCHTIENTLPPLPHPSGRPAPRLIYARIGVVLHRQGGALAKMLPAFRLGLGGPVGDGEQILSWISRHDLCRALLWCAQTPEVAGPINLVAPAPLRQKDFARTLGHLLKRPALWPTPAWLVRLLFGQMGQELLLQSCAVSADKLLQTGFVFHHATAKAALKAALTEA